MIPKNLTDHVPAQESNIHRYMDELIICMRTAHGSLHEQQWRLKTKDSNDPICTKRETEHLSYS